MADRRITFEIDASRLVRYFRARWCAHTAVAGSLVASFILVGADGNVFHPAFVIAIASLVVVVTATILLVPAHVRAFKFWIEGTTLRINQGILVRKSKSIPLDRVTDIEMVQGLLMRACGIWLLRIQTAGSTEQEPEGMIWGAQQPDSVRDTIVSMRDKAAFKADTAS